MSRPKRRAVRSMRARLAVRREGQKRSLVGRTIECPSHGAQPWDGEAVCTACHAVHRCRVGEDMRQCCDRFDQGKTLAAICASCWHSLALAEQLQGRERDPLAN